MTKPESLLKPLIELIFASTLWGFGFTAAIWAMESLSATATTLYRFLGAFVFGSLVWLWQRPSKQELFQDFWLSRPLGIYLALTILLQTFGLLTVGPGKSAFLTVLYVVIVPVLSFVFEGEKLSRTFLFCLVLALLGMGLMVNLSLSDFQRGDLFTIACAVAAAFHIRSVGLVSRKAHSGFNLNLFQCLWVCLFCLPLYFFEMTRPDLAKGHWDLTQLTNKSTWGLLSLTFGSSLIAFFLQVRAQKKISATLASLIFLLESPFSALFGISLLGEVFSTLQTIGAGLIFLACGIAIYSNSSLKKEP